MVKIIIREIKRLIETFALRFEEELDQSDKIAFYALRARYSTIVRGNKRSWNPTFDERQFMSHGIIFLELINDIRHHRLNKKSHTKTKLRRFKELVRGHKFRALYKEDKETRVFV